MPPLKPITATSTTTLATRSYFPANPGLLLHGVLRLLASAICGAPFTILANVYLDNGYQTELFFDRSETMAATSIKPEFCPHSMADTTDGFRANPWTGGPTGREA